MKYISVFEDFKYFDWSILDEEIEDMILNLKEDGEKVSKLIPIEPLSLSILDELCMDSKYESYIRVYVSNISTISSKEVLKYAERVCRYLSCKKDLRVISTLLSTSGCLIFGGPKIIYYMDRILKFENRDHECDVLEIDNRDELIYKKYSILKDNGYDLLTKPSLNGFRVELCIFNNKRQMYGDKLIVFSFLRSPYISEKIEYIVNIETFPKSETMSRIELLNIDRFSVDIYDESNPVEFYRILIENSIRLLGLEKIALISDILSILSVQNDYFNIDDIENSKDQVVLYTINKKININIDDKLNIYIGDKSERNKTTLDELVHDIYLKLTNRNES